MSAVLTEALLLFDRFSLSLEADLSRRYSRMFFALPLFLLYRLGVIPPSLDVVHSVIGAGFFIDFITHTVLLFFKLPLLYFPRAIHKRFPNPFLIRFYSLSLLLC